MRAAAPRRDLLGAQLVSRERPHADVGGVAHRRACVVDNHSSSPSSVALKEAITGANARRTA